MNFYTSIAENYDYIFPYNKMQKDFINSVVNNVERKNINILDIGCGTCNLSLELAKEYKHVTAIDLDNKMIKKGKEKKGNNYTNLKIMEMDMTKIDENFQVGEFDIITCFGNTLVHLENIEIIGDFFRKAFACLNQNGLLLIQVINYDRIIKNEVTGLKTIENNKIKFIRNYYYKEDTNKLDFETILTVKKDDQIIENTIELYPILKRELDNALRSGGFENIEYFGNFKMENFTDESVPIIIMAKKGR